EFYIFKPKIQRMSAHSKQRQEKNCLNCGKLVEHRFCGFCGQENIETHQRFGDLVYHFFEDLTHYEGKFWKTIRLLLFSPGKLTKIYLSGQRVSYVPPVRLYIFISFLAFFIPYLMPSEKQDLQEKRQKFLDSYVDETADGSMIAQKTELGFMIDLPGKFENKQQLDSTLESYHGELDLASELLYRKSYDLRKYNPLEVGEKFISTLVKSIPKALFIYMPLFAFVLGIFHRNKKWFYFDHGIFTLHYFSFALLVFVIFSVLVPLDLILPDGFPVEIQFIAVVSYSLLLLFYFFVAHKKLYGDKLMVSILKSTGVIIINLFLLLLVFIGIVMLSVYLLH
ncbi:MAG: DUF3667 domain-containing protein, partial [Bacteroidetes bacterium]|nr:DUF3667 domain-containing protein [Bacteroidota bacterium]